MILYHFMPREYAIENILFRRLKISRILELNDPFDFFAVRLTDSTLRRNHRRAMAGMNDRFGQISFCKDWKNPVMWAHYADNHRGICLGVEMPDASVVQVSYKKEMPEINQVFDEQGLAISGGMPNPSWTTKYSHWSYEKEYKWIGDISANTTEGGLHFMNFDVHLKKVILGHRCTLERAHISRALRDLSNVKILRARPAFQKFSMTEQLDESLAR